MDTFAMLQAQITLQNSALAQMLAQSRELLTAVKLLRADVEQHQGEIEAATQKIGALMVTVERIEADVKAQRQAIEFLADHAGLEITRW